MFEEIIAGIINALYSYILIFLLQNEICTIQVV